MINKTLSIQGQLTGAAASQDKFNIEDKGYLVNRNITSIFTNSSPEIHLNLEYSGGTSTKQKWGGGKVWILSHGFVSNPQTFKDENKNLVDAIHKQSPDDNIITVDWSKAANEITPGTSAQWIKEVADYTFDRLKDWGLNFADANKVNLIGHSLGTFVGSELANNFVKGTKDIIGSKVATLIALEPASTIDDVLGGKYDLDALKDGSQNPVRFDSVANFSRAFVGTQSLLADSTLAGTANESILVNFASKFQSLSHRNNRNSTCQIRWCQIDKCAIYQDRQFTSFNKKADILWRKDTGALEVWQMNGAKLPSTKPLTYAGNPIEMI